MNSRLKNVPLPSGKITSLDTYDFATLINDLLLDPTLTDAKNLPQGNFNKIIWMLLIPVINIITKEDQVDEEFMKI